MAKPAHRIKVKHTAVRKRAKDARLWRWRATCTCGWSGRRRRRKGAAGKEGDLHLEALSGTEERT